MRSANKEDLRGKKMIGKMFEVRNKLILEYMHVKGKKEAYKRGLKEMWNSSGDEMLYKYC